MLPSGRSCLPMLYRRDATDRTLLRFNAWLSRQAGTYLGHVLKVPERSWELPGGFRWQQTRVWLFNIIANTCDNRAAWQKWKSSENQLRRNARLPRSEGGSDREVRRGLPSGLPRKYDQSFQPRLLKCKRDSCIKMLGHQLLFLLLVVLRGSLLACNLGQLGPQTGAERLARSSLALLIQEARATGCSWKLRLVRRIPLTISRSRWDKCLQAAPGARRSSGRHSLAS